MNVVSSRGSNLELQTAAFFQAHGYLVRRGVRLSVAAGSADVTDIDLLALRYAVPLLEERLVADCKERRRSHPFERILWTLGLASFSRATRSIVVIPHVVWQAREFAHQGGVEVLGTDTIQDWLSKLPRDVVFVGDADPKTAYAWELLRRQSNPSIRELAKESFKLRQMLVVGHPLSNLNRIIRMLRTISDTRVPPADRLYTKLVSFDAAVTASVMLVRFAAESKWTAERDWMDNARKRLTYGDVPPQKARQLAKLALDRDFYEGLPAPEYTDELLEVIKGLIEQPLLASAVPLALDFYLFGRVLGGISENYSWVPLASIQQPAIALGRKLLSALAYSAQLPLTLWTDGIQLPQPSPSPRPRARARGSGSRSVDSKVARLFDPPASQED